MDLINNRKDLVFLDLHSDIFYYITLFIGTLIMIKILLYIDNMIRFHQSGICVIFMKLLIFMKK